MLPVVTFSVSALSRGATWGLPRAAWIRAPSRRGAGHLPGGGPTGLPALWIPGKEYSPVAIYSLHVSNVSRAAGSSAVASCSYITSRRMRDERTGEAFNGFGRRERVEHVCTMLPEGAPGEYLDPERLFNAVEMAEKRSDARPAKKIMVALPREFDARERFRALEDFISWNITANGYACTYAIHTDKDGRNPTRTSSSPTGASTRRPADGRRRAAASSRWTPTAGASPSSTPTPDGRRSAPETARSGSAST